MSAIENRDKSYDFDNGELLACPSSSEDNKYGFYTRDHSGELISREDAPKLIDALTRWLEAGAE